MIEIRQNVAPVSGAPANDVADQQEGMHLASNPGAEPAARSTLPDADPVTKFGSMYGLHPQVPANGNAPLFLHEATHSNKPTAPPPPKVYDVAHTDAATLEALKKGTVVERKIAFLIEHARTSYGDLCAKGARILVTASAGNGGQPVMTLVGPKFDRTKPADVHTHYHGDNATVVDPIGSKAGTNARIRDVIAHNPQAVFVLPEAVRRGDDTKWGVDSAENKNRFDYKASWSNVRSQSQTTDDALTAAGITKIGKETVSAHSRGGEALSHIMNDQSGRGLRADHLELHDCLYGSQSDVVAWARTANGKAVKSVVYYHGTNDAGADAGIERAFGKKFWKVDMQQLRKIDPKINPVYHDQNGNTYPRDYPNGKDKNGKPLIRHDYVRNFHENPHYRTTGEFLGAPLDLRAI